MKPSRILLYSHDGFGLGHLRRNLNVASRLVKDLPQASALLLAGFPGVPGVELPDGVDLVKLPSVRKVATENWRPRTLRVDEARLREMRRALASTAFRSFAPDLVVVDYMPGGVFGELAQSLQWARAACGSRVVLGLRDILDAPDVTRAAWARAGHGNVLARYFDRVLVYGQQDVFDADAAYGISAHLPGRVEHVGYLCAGTTGSDPADVRLRLGVRGSERLVVVTAGGGADAFPMMSLALRALRPLAARLGLRIVAVTGPLMLGDDCHALELLGAGMPAQVWRTMADLPDVLAASDLVITMGAYNTLAESLRLGRSVLAIPRLGPSAEQRMRTELFAQRGLLDVALEHDSPESVADRIEALLARPTAPRVALDFAGLERTTERLVQLLRGEVAGGASRSVPPVRAGARRHAR